MTNFEINNAISNAREKKEKQFEFLSESDIELINRSLEKLKNYFSELNPKELPTSIVFLETSARPLLYAIRPLVKQIYETKDIKIPTMPFLSIHRNEDLSWYVLGENFFFERKIDEVEEHIEYLTERYKKYGEYETEIVKNKKILNILKKYFAFLENTDDEEKLNIERNQVLGQLPQEYLNIYNATKALEQRVFEIIYNNDERDSQNTILFIDDYVKDGKTFTILNDILEKYTMVDNKYVFFSFFNDKREMTERYFPKDHFLFGATSEDKNYEEYYGFKYRFIHKTFDPDEIKRKKQKNEKHIGVRKTLGEKYVAISPIADKTQVQALKKQMTNIGQEFIKNNT